MARPPRPVKESPFRFDVWMGAVGQGLGLLIALGGMAWWGQRQGWSMDSLRSGVMAGLAVGAFLLVLANRSRSSAVRETKNPWIFRMGMALFLGMVALGWIPGLRQLLDLGPLSLQALTALLCVTVFCQVWLTAFRWLRPC